MSNPPTNIQPETGDTHLHPPGWLPRLTPVLHLTRITTAFAAVSNVWFVVLWTRAVDYERVEATAALREGPLWLLLTGATAMAVGLFAFGTALNDAIDVRRDRQLNPARPLAAGRISMEIALAWTIGALMVALLGSAALGLPAVIMCLATAAAILAYNAALRFVPSIGLVLLGMIYGSHMMAANCFLVFVWPVLLAMTHALLAGAITHRLRRARPRLDIRVMVTAGIAYVFWAGVLVFVGHDRSGQLWPDFVPLTAIAWVMPLALAFVALAIFKTLRAADRRIAAEKVQRYAALWLSIYATVWMLATDHHAEALMLAVLTAVGFLGMTILREVFSLAEHPVGYRR